LTQGIALYLVS